MRNRFTGSFREKTILENYGSAELLRRCKLHDVVSVKERMQTPHRGLPHQGRSVGPHKFSWVEMVFQALNRLPRDVRSSRCVDYDIFIGCFNPDDFVNGHEQDSFVIFDREPGEPLTVARRLGP